MLQLVLVQRQLAVEIQQLELFLQVVEVLVAILVKMELTAVLEAAVL